MTRVLTDLAQKGWALFDPDPELAPWVKAAQIAGAAALVDPHMREQWLVCGDTWFVGVDALPTTPDGTINDVPFCGQASDFIATQFRNTPLHPAQLSITWPGYPKPRIGETDGAFAYRQKRGAAHLDGLQPHGPQKRRRYSEFHAYILGIPLTDVLAQESPTCVWEGSHHMVQSLLATKLGPHDPLHWPQIDLTDAYQDLRAQIFETCPQRDVICQKGQAFIMHRHLLHGVGPWLGTTQNDAGRQIAFFRPHWTGDLQGWLQG